MVAALQAADTVQGLASQGPPLAYSQARHLRIHLGHHLLIHRAHQLCIHPGHHLLIHRVSPVLLQGTPPA
mgnify:FL=1